MKTNRSNDVSSEKSVCLLVCEDFDESVGLADRLRATVGDERELADVVFDALKRNDIWNNVKRDLKTTFETTFEIRLKAVPLA